MSRVLAVASGKGGTGKTSMSVNLSVALGRAGRTVCLLDADLGLSNVDVLLGISPQVTLEHVLFEGVPMERAMFRAGHNLDVVPGGSGVSRLADLSREGRATLAGEFSKLSGYDYIVVDGSPGISSQVLSLCLACPELLVVVNPDPSSITDAYALVKVLHENGLRRSPYVLLNRVKSAGEAAAVFARLRAAMAKYLRLDARMLGHVPQDPHMAAAAARQRPLVELYPASLSGRAILALARALDEARLPAGTASADPATVMGGAMARMRECAPVRERKNVHFAEASQALDAAMDLAARLATRLATRLDGAGDPGQDPGQAPDQDPGGEQTLSRLRALLARARDCLEGVPAAPSQLPASRESVAAVVVSSDESIGAILRESLESAGIRVVADEEARRSTGLAGGQARGGPRAGGIAGQSPKLVAVAYWRGAPGALDARLAALSWPSYILVRSISDKAVPRLARSPAEVLDMPYRLSELAGSVRRFAQEKRAV